ncbi:hypothetical protein ACVG95_000611 [Pseudomonas aeruginosa]
MLRSRRPTLAEQRYPDTPEFQQAALEFMANAVDIISDAIWAGYDSLKEEVFEQVSNVERGDEGERSVTQLLAPRISRALTGFEPFYCQPGVKEMESRLAAPAQAPEYDIAFVLWSNERICWPLEAKLLSTPDAIASYIADINNEFMTCRYAPFSAGGAMLAYLMDGEPERFLANVSARLGTELKELITSSSRPHKTSRHIRNVPTGKDYPTDFTCHHIVMLFDNSSTQTDPKRH